MPNKKHQETLQQLVQGLPIAPKLVRYKQVQDPFTEEESWEQEDERSFNIPARLHESNGIETEATPTWHKQCDHSRYWNSALSGDIFVAPPLGTQTSYRAYKCPPYAVFAFSDAEPLYTRTDLWVDVNDYKGLGNRAFGEWMQSDRFLSTGFSIVNFLLELKDMRAYLRGILHYWRELRRFVGYFSHQDSIMDGIRALARGELKVNFGILPFLRDIGTMFHRIFGFTKLWRDFLEYNGVFQTAVLTRQQFAVPSPPDRAIAFQGGLGPGHAGLSSYGQSWAEYCAYIAYTYDIQGLQSAFAPLRGLLDTAGVRMDASIVWEAIPYSFVVDWFLETDQVLRDIRKDNLPVKITLQECSHHIKVTRSCNHHFNNDPNQGLVENVVTFSRRSFIPTKTELPPTFRKVGLRKLLLGAALITVASSPKGYPSVLV